MITIEKTPDLTFPYPLSQLGDPERLLFFDIETTGLSADHSGLYLIGCLCIQDGKPRFIQWFADRAGAEAEVLETFFSFLTRFDTLVHFNGDHFDIPYLEKRCRRLGLSGSFSGIRSIDIYRQIRPFKNLLGLENVKQKTVERFLGISREDRYSGGELIEVYREYLQTQCPSCLNLLLLHNEEDLTGMPQILPVLQYPDFVKGPLTVTDMKVVTENLSADAGGAGRQKAAARQLLVITCESGCRLPVPVETARPPVRLRAGGEQAVFEVELYSGTLRHYFADWKNYYYVPAADTAIPRESAGYLGRKERTAATPATCYTRRTGWFLPQFVPLWEPEMKAGLRDRISYAALADTDLLDPEKQKAYLSQLFHYLGLRALSHK